MLIVHFTLLKKACLFLFCVYECFACMYVCVTCLPGVLRDLKRASDLLALELEIAVSLCVSARTQSLCQTFLLKESWKEACVCHLLFIFFIPDYIFDPHFCFIIICVSLICYPLSLF